MSLFWQRYRPAVALIGALGLVWGAVTILPSQKAVSAPKPAPKKPEPPPLPPPPTDLNDLRMRVAALQMIYELDLSPDQLRALRAAAAGTAEVRQRAAGKGTPKLLDALKEFHEALLKGEDTDRINELRSQVTTLEDDDEVDLDDDVHPTNGARLQTSPILHRIKASQVAAYLSEHADEISDPVEQMMDTLVQVRNAESDDPEGDLRQTAEEVGWLVVGMDVGKAKQVSDQVTTWFNAGRVVSDAAFPDKAALLEESAKKITGDVSPVVVLGHWVENEVATLLSNPQLTSAIDQVLAARAKTP